MKTKIFYGLFVLAAIWLAGCSKPAGPHFTGAVTAILGKNGQSVVMSWKEAEIGNNQNIDYEASAAGTATYVCVNAGGKCLNAANKATISRPVIATITFSSGQNGQIVGSLLLLPPGPGTFACPGGQTLMLADFSLTDIQVRDITNNISKAADPDAISATIFVCP